MDDTKEKLRRDVATLTEFASNNMEWMTCEDYVATKQVCAALSDVLNAATPPPDAALAEHADRVLCDLCDTTCTVTPDLRDSVVCLIRALLRALSQPATVEQVPVEQVPVEWKVESGTGTTRRFSTYAATKSHRDEGWTVTPLFAADTTPKMQAFAPMEEMARLRAELKAANRLLEEARAQVPVAHMHNKRADVIHTSVKSLLSDAVNYGPESMLRPIDKLEHYTIPLYAAPVPAQPVAEKPIGFISDYALEELCAGRWPITQIVTCKDNIDGLSGNNAIYIATIKE